MYAIRNNIHKVYKGAAEAVLPARSQSRFKEEGVRARQRLAAYGDMASLAWLSALL